MIQDTGVSIHCTDTGYSAQGRGYRIQITEYRIQITDYRIQYTWYRIQCTGYMSQYTEYRLQITGYSAQIQKLVTNKQTNRKQTDSGVYRVAPTTKNFISQKMSFHVLRWGYPTSIDRFCCRSWSLSLKSPFVNLDTTSGTWLVQPSEQDWCNLRNRSLVTVVPQVLVPPPPSPLQRFLFLSLLWTRFKYIVYFPSKCLIFD